MEGLLGSRVKDGKDSKDERDQARQGPRGLGALRLRVGLRSFDLVSVPREALSVRSIARISLGDSSPDPVACNDRLRYRSPPSVQRSSCATIPIGLRLNCRVENPGGRSEKNQTCCDAMKQGSDELLDQHGHLLDIAQYTFEVPKYAQLATMQHKPKHSERRAGDVRALLRKFPRRTPKESHMRQTRDTGIGC